LQYSKLHYNNMIYRVDSGIAPREDLRRRHAFGVSHIPYIGICSTFGVLSQSCVRTDVYVRVTCQNSKSLFSIGVLGNIREFISNFLGVPELWVIAEYKASYGVLSYLYILYIKLQQENAFNFSIPNWISRQYHRKVNPLTYCVPVMFIHITYIIQQLPICRYHSNTM
jgi:hypothetical protein